MVFAGIGAVLGLHALFVWLAPMHDLFGSATLDLDSLTLAAGASLSILPVTCWRSAGGSGAPANGLARVGP